MAGKALVRNNNVDAPEMVGSGAEVEVAEIDRQTAKFKSHDFR